MKDIQNNKKTNKQIALAVMIVSALLFVFSIYDFNLPIKQFMLGCFGLATFPILFFVLLFCLGILTNRTFVFSVRYIFYLALCYVFFVCVLHICLTGFSDVKLSYGEYLISCFKSMYTPGGLLAGVLTYPITSLLHDVAGIVFFCIALIISAYFVFSYLEMVKQGKVEQENFNKAKPEKYEYFDNVSKNFVNSSSSEELLNCLPKENETRAQNFVEDDNAEEDDGLIIKDNEETLLAKKKLGLSCEDDEQEDKTKAESSNDEILKLDENSANYKLFNQDVEWQNRAKDRRFGVVNQESIRKYNALFEENKKYLKTLFDVNLDSSNPIINGEDAEDYKQKMKIFKEVNSQPFTRELDVNQLLTSQKNVGNKIEDESNKNFANKERANSFSQNANNGNLSNNFVKENFNNKNDNNANIVKNEINNLDVNNKIVDDLDDIDTSFIDEIEGFNEKTPIKPNLNNDSGVVNLTQDKVKFDGNLNSGLDNLKFQKSFDTTKLSDGNVESSLGKVHNLSINPSNVYNLPDSLKKNVLNNGSNAEANTQDDALAITSATKFYSYNGKYVKPPIDLLETYINEEDLTTNHQKNIEILERVLDEFKIPAKVEAVRRGSAVTRYELRMPIGIPVRKIHQHASDIALALASPGEVRIETPIRGKSAVGVEVPNAKIDKVGFKDIIASNDFQNAKKPLTFALGKDIDGSIYCCDLASMPHLLVAGSTGSGKSVCLNTLILSFIFRTSPEDLRLILVDPKRVEFAIYNGLPHLLLEKAIVDSKKALNAFDWLINEMERRFTVFQECYVKNIGEYNAQPEVVSKKVPKLPYIVLIVDELADLVVTTNKKDLEDKIIRLTQKARAAGIHVILATQRPSVDIITGTIKINLPSRIAFAVTSYVDSKTILDQGGAEKLLGKGDMLYSPQSSEPVRVQGAFVDTPEVRRVVEFVKNNNQAYFDKDLQRIIDGETNPVSGASVGASGGEEFDVLMPDALKLVIENGQASISMLQRRFSIGFSRAARIIDQMELAKFISSSDGSKPRSVYISMDDFNQIYGNK